MRTPSLSILNDELKGSVSFFQDYTNLDAASPGYGLTVDATKRPAIASIAAVGFALSAWVIACERGLIPREDALAVTRGTLRTLFERVPHHRGFFAHFLDIQTAERWRKCEYSTIDSALCLNGVITAAAYFQDSVVRQLADDLLGRVDWQFLVFEVDGQARFRMAYNPDRGGDYVQAEPGFISQWDMAAEQKMMYLQAAGQLDAPLARRLYHGFRRDTALVDGEAIIFNPGGTLFAYLFSEAWLDTAAYLDPDGIDWFRNTRLAAAANRQYCIDHAAAIATFHERSWGLSAGDSPWGYDVSGAPPRFKEEAPNGTVSIYSALACLPYLPNEVLAMADYLYHEQPGTWGPYGFYDSYNLTVEPAWYSRAVYGIDKGCSLLMIENYLSGLIWDVYTRSPEIEHGLKALGFQKRSRATEDE